MAKKVLALILAVMMIAALAASAVAADETGKITITNASAGQKYELFKLLDATYNTTTQTTAYSTQDPDLKSALAAVKSGENAIFIVGANPDTEGNYSVAVADGMSEAALTWIKANAATYGTNVKEVIFDSVNKIEWDVPYGYYYVKSGLGALLTINSNTPEVTIIDKNDTAPKDAIKEFDKLSADVGETVSYTVTFTATNFVTKDAETEQIKSYVITDTATGVTLNSNIVVKVNDDNPKTPAATAFDKDGKLTLSWVDEAGNSIYKSPAKVEITYTGTVTEKAIGKNAVNKVKISYVTDNGTKSIPDPDPVTTKVYSVDITKVNDETGEKQKKLEGAEFVLIKMTGGKETFYKWTDDEGVTWEDSVKNATSKKTDSDGTAKFEGFAAGTYYLREVDSPKGYALPEEDFVFSTEKAGEGNRVATEVQNKAGSKLPTTGGIGTTVFYVMGSILVIGAAVVLLSKKRMRG